MTIWIDYTNMMSQVSAAELDGARTETVTPIRSEAREIRGAFCNHVHFFSSEADAAPWQARYPDGWVLPASEAFDLGTRFVEGLGGDCCG